MEKRAVHFIASRTKNYADKRELMNMVNELLGIQYNIAKANRTDRKVQNLAAYINADTLRAIHKTMDRKKAYGIDKVTKEDYEKNLEENLANLVKRMKNGSYRLESPVMKINWWKMRLHRYWSRFMNRSFIMRALDSARTGTAIRQ